MRMNFIYKFFHGIESSQTSENPNSPLVLLLHFKWCLE